MATWHEIRAEAPALMDAGDRLISPNGDGIAFLATVRPDGGPRVHPVAPVLAGGRLHVFIVNLSPKYQDLLRDGRFAMHALPTPAGGEEFYFTGRARECHLPERRAEVTAASGNRLGHLEFEVLFELDIRRVLHTVWSGWGTPKVWPEYRRWPSRPNA
ncbi:MAG TPA: pyridoxamine 5'-phosphate oxidase family protein [Dehalococcoidia bacterium]|jgi:hypothetical protein